MKFVQHEQGRDGDTLSGRYKTTFRLTLMIVRIIYEQAKVPMMLIKGKLRVFSLKLITGLRI